MKIVLDIDRLLQQGQLTQSEYDRLKVLSQKSTGATAFNFLIGFGVIATAGGAIALYPNSKTAIGLGLLMAAVGVYLSRKLKQEWGILGSILLLVGSIAAAGGILSITDASVTGFLVVTVLCLIGAILAKSGLLAALAALALACTAGAMMEYGHATYELTIRQPTVTVVLFTALAIGAYQLSKILPLDYQRLAIIFSRTSVFIVNFGFWVGSLWGDSLTHISDSWDSPSRQIIPDWVFVIAWAVALIATGVWAARNNKHWVVNVVAVFAAIHFYTQYFERLGASPGGLLVAGVAALGIALVIVRYNKSVNA